MIYKVLPDAVGTVARRAISLRQLGCLDPGRILQPDESFENPRMNSRPNRVVTFDDAGGLGASTYALASA